MDRREARKERSNCSSPIKTHLDKTGVQGPDGKVVLACASYHVPEPGGRLMAPIRFEQHCHRRHPLTFEIDDPKREVSHEPEGATHNYVLHLFAWRLKTLPCASPRI